MDLLLAPLVTCDPTHSSIRKALGQVKFVNGSHCALRQICGQPTNKIQNNMIRIIERTRASQLQLILPIDLLPNTGN